MKHNKLVAVPILMGLLIANACGEDTSCDTIPQEGTCICIAGHWSCSTPCDHNAKPADDCTCEGTQWVCGAPSCDETQKPSDDCTCEGTQWVCQQTGCDDNAKPEGDCTCLEDHWICDTPNCDENAKPEGDCTCIESEWVCQIACPSECPDNCTEGICNKPPCPDACPDSCDAQGKCPCPEACPTSCDDNYKCPVICPSECPNDCDENGNCPTVCPPECPNDCDDEGKCPPKCPAECPDSCDANLKCPIVCPSACPNDCDDKGICPCPSTCTTSCNTNGVCQCPSKCAKTCNANGECPVMCGSETVSSIYFHFKEQDVLIPSFSARTSVNVPVYVKTNKATYTIDEAPCAKDIVLSSSDKSIMTISKDGKNAVIKSVAAGTVTASAKIKNQDLTATMKVHVLNPGKLKGNLANFNTSTNKYSHLYKIPYKLKRTGRVSQGFDYYSGTYFYFTQLSVDGQFTNNNKYPYDRKGIIIIPVNQNDGSFADKVMTLYKAGHGQNLSIERTDNKSYIWLGNYGSFKKDSKNDGAVYKEGYSYSQTLCRVEWQPGKALYPDEITEHYFLPALSSTKRFFGLEAALDQKNNRIAVRAKNDDGNTYIKIYNFKNFKKIEQNTTVTLPYPIAETQGTTDKFVKDQHPKIKVKDLSKLDPINAFSKGDFPVQGVEIENGLLYAITGLPEELAKPEGKHTYKSKITLKIYTYSGKEIATYYLQTSTANNGYLKSSELDDMVNFKEDGVSYYSNGYYEPEGIRVSNGKVYISMTVKFDYTNKDTGKSATAARQFIFSYNLAV